jgi:hypothetical protein
MGPRAWYAEFLLEVDLKILLRQTEAGLNFKISLISLHIDPAGPAGMFSSWLRSIWIFY